MSMDRLEKLIEEMPFPQSLPLASIEDVAFSNHPCYAVNDSGEIVGLNLSNLALSEVPQSVSLLTELQILRLHGNNLTDLPTALLKLSNLTHLYLPVNRFVEIPSIIGEFSTLEVLGFNQNGIKEIPSSISNLCHLRKLGLNGNDLASMPYPLLGLTCLESLFIGNNHLSFVPDCISQLSQLKELDLSRNPIHSLSSEFSNLVSLCSLSLSQTKLIVLPEIIFQLKNLENLDISALPIAFLPEDIAFLDSLKVLNLSGTQIRSLPGGFRELQYLSALHLSGLKLVEIPSELFHLVNLATLNLSSTRARSIPAEIGRLSELTWLDLSSMGLTSIPASIFGLKKLRFLNLVSNRLRVLPPQITQSSLEIFWAKSKLEDDEGIFLDNNPLESPPPEIVRKGTQVVHTYFNSLKGNTKPIDEVKVLLIGDGGAGKTSLVKRLIGQSFDENESQTHGINIDDFHFLVGGKRIKVHFWDFGGQEIMHATHQFFLSKRSAYILVLDGRKDEKTEYWLKHIEAFGGDSPVLVIINKIDQNPSFDVNRRFLFEKYHSIRDFLRVSCSTGIGIVALQKTLSVTLSRIDHTKTTWADNWFNVKERIELMPEDFISFSKFRDICCEEGVEDDAEQETLVDFLHDLGVALRFNDISLRDTNVINPRWITGGVYRLINSEEIASAGGVLRLDSLNHLLDHKIHPSEKHGFIIELMKKFELCYEINRYSVLLPSLLPIEEPKLSLGQEDFLRFFIDYDFLPKSIMPRFIVRMHNDIYEDFRWRTGVVLQNNAFDCRAVVRADEIDRRIEIVIYGPQRRDYLGVILHTFREINDSFERIKHIERVPMPDRIEVTISYNHLLRLEAKGVRAYMPDGTEKEYDVQELLGYVKPERRTEEQILELLRELREKNDNEATLMDKANKVFLLQPNFLGLGLNLNELIRRVIKGNAKDKAGKTN